MKAAKPIPPVPNITFISLQKGVEYNLTSKCLPAMVLLVGDDNLFLQEDQMEFMNVLKMKWTFEDTKELWMHPVKGPIIFGFLLLLLYLLVNLKAQHNLTVQRINELDRLRLENAIEKFESIKQAQHRCQSCE